MANPDESPAPPSAAAEGRGAPGADPIDEDATNDAVHAHLGEADLATRTASRASAGPARPARRRSPSEANRVAPGTQIGRYVVVEILGRGGMGVVWKAHDPHLDRNVALKRVRVRAGPEAGTARERLMREAQALAQLSHPNVVAVHDVGLLGDDLFVAMELVEGQTLRQWLPAHLGDSRAIVAVLLGAGEGLAAAHRAGLVHRDFKPENVVVALDGRARVLDFGLARPSSDLSSSAARTADDEATSPVELTPLPAIGSSSAPSRPRSARLTIDGAAVGTPRYMAPEQHRNGTVDARSDQFSFCVTLYEGLFDARPFEGADLRELRWNVLAGNLRMPPPRPGVPARWRRAVMRGLASEPADRFPTMEALLAELRRDPRVARRRALVGVAGVGLAGLALFGLLRSPGTGPRCRLAEPRLAEVWGDPARTRVRAAFAASERSYARDVLARAEPLLDRWASAWQAMRVDACEATHVRGEQSTALLDQRMSCLDRKLDQMTGLVAALGDRPGPELIDRTVQAVTAVGDVADCSRREQLAGATARPLAPADRTRLASVEHAMDRAEVAVDTGTYAAGLTLAARAVDEARGLDAPDVLAGALWLRGRLEERTGAYAAAEITLHEALRVAARAGDHRLAARAWIDLVLVANEHENRLERATAYVQAAEVAVGFVAAVDQPPLHAALITRRGLVELKRTNFDAARRDLEEAVRAHEALYGDSDHRTGGTLVTLGLVLMKRGEYVRAEEVLGRALAVYERSLGSGHPQLSTALVNLGGVLSYQRKHAEAEAVYRRALAIDESALGPDHSYVADGLTNLGAALVAQGEPDEAATYFTRALAIQERVLGADHPDVAWTLTGLGETLTVAGRFGEARTLFTRAHAISVARNGADNEQVAQIGQHVAMTYLAEGNAAEAYRLLAENLRRFERLLGREHPRTAMVLIDLADAAGRLGRHAEVVTLGERALALMAGDKVAVSEPAKAWVRFLIARARHQLGTDRAAQLVVIRAAAAALGPDVEDRRRHATIEAWLAAHR